MAKLITTSINGELNVTSGITANSLDVQTLTVAGKSITGDSQSSSGSTSGGTGTYPKTPTFDSATVNGNLSTKTLTVSGDTISASNANMYVKSLTVNGVSITGNSTTPSTPTTLDFGAEAIKYDGKYQAGNTLNKGYYALGPNSSNSYFCIGVNNNSSHPSISVGSESDSRAAATTYISGCSEGRINLGGVGNNEDTAVFHNGLPIGAYIRQRAVKDNDKYLSPKNNTKEDGWKEQFNLYLEKGIWLVIATVTWSKNISNDGYRGVGIQVSGSDTTNKRYASNCTAIFSGMNNNLVVSCSGIVKITSPYDSMTNSDGQIVNILSFLDTKTTSSTGDTPLEVTATAVYLSGNIEKTFSYSPSTKDTSSFNENSKNTIKASSDNYSDISFNRTLTTGSITPIS